MAFYQCFVYGNTAIVTAENDVSQGGATVLNTFETGDISFVRSPKQKINLYEYNGTKTNGSTDGTIIVSADEVAIESYMNRIDPQKTSGLSVTASVIDIPHDADNFWFNYVGTGTSVFNLPSLADVPEDFEIAITNKATDKERIIVESFGTDVIDSIYTNKILAYGSWARLKVFDREWIIAYEVSMNDSNPGIPSGDEIVFDKNITILAQENEGQFRYVGAAAAILTLPDTSTITSAWSITVTNDSSLGSTLSIHTFNATQTVGGSQIYYLNHGLSKKISYAGAGSSFTISDVAAFSSYNLLTQPIAGDLLSFETQSDGALGWGPSNKTFLESLFDDSTPQLGGNFDFNSKHFFNGSDADSFLNVFTDANESRLRNTLGSEYIEMYQSLFTHGNIRSSNSLTLKTGNNKNLALFCNGTGKIILENDTTLTGTPTNGSGKGITAESSGIFNKFVPIGTDLSSSYTSTLSRRNVLSCFELNSTTLTPSGIGSTEDPDHLSSISQGKDTLQLTCIEQTTNNSTKASINLAASGANIGVTLIATNSGRIELSNKGLANSYLTFDVNEITTADKTISFFDGDCINVGLGKHTDGTVINTSTNRPSPAKTGMMFFDTTLAAAGKPIWYTGVNWVDHNGVVV